MQQRHFGVSDATHLIAIVELFVNLSHELGNPVCCSCGQPRRSALVFLCALHRRATVVAVAVASNATRRSACSGVHSGTHTVAVFVSARVAVLWLYLIVIVIYKSRT